MSRHPGTVLLDEFLTPLGLNANRLAEGIGVHRSTVGRVLAGEQRLTPEFAARLGAYFGVPAKWWLLMQAEHDATTLDDHARSVAAVKPLKLPADVLLTPNGVMRLSAPRRQDQAAVRPVSLSAGRRAETVDLAPAGSRRVREVRYANGSVALVGDES